MTDIRRVKLQIRGRVQGVYFRKSAQHLAQVFNLQGFATNLPDGSVLIEVEGESKQVEKFIEWCGKGPAEAKVESVAIEDQRGMAGYQGFYMR